MSKPTLYKKKSIDSVRGRETTPLTVDEKATVNSIVGKFVELFKAEHL